MASGNATVSSADMAPRPGSAAGPTRWTLSAIGPVVLGPFVPLLIVWEVVADLRIYPAYLFPGPSAVGVAFWELATSGGLWTHVADSLLRAVLGFVVGVGIALPLGLLMGISRPIARYFSPLVIFFQAIPGLAWIPLVILWLGIGYKAVTFIIFISVFFPVLLNTIVGVRSIRATVIEAARTLGASHLALVREIYIPGALPSIMAGFRLGFGFGWRALVAGEMIASSSGLGFMIFDARQSLRSDIVIVGMIMLGLVWLVLDWIVLRPIEHRTVERWGILNN